MRVVKVVIVPSSALLLWGVFWSHHCLSASQGDTRPRSPSLMSHFLPQAVTEKSTTATVVRVWPPNGPGGKHCPVALQGRASLSEALDSFGRVP